ncbi:MAG: hypothetical protein JW910_04140, partial [Anaerolineae bacterium]|nr:hypothetical protein [Anaerolineae bacterium]
MERSEYTQIERRVRRFYRRQTWLMNHMLIFVAFVSAIWLHYLSFALRDEMFHVNALMDRVIVTLVWFILLVVHYLNARQAAAMEREIDRLAREETGQRPARPKRRVDDLATLNRLADEDDDYLPLDTLL